MFSITFITPISCDYFWEIVMCIFFLSTLKGLCLPPGLKLKQMGHIWSIGSLIKNIMRNTNEWDGKMKERGRISELCAQRHQDRIACWDYVPEQPNSPVCGFGKLEGGRKALFPGPPGIKRLMWKWRDLSAWNRALFDVPLWDTEKNKVRKGFY